MNADKTIFDCDFKFQISNSGFQIRNFGFLISKLKLEIRSLKFLCVFLVLFFSIVARSQDAPITAQNFHQWGAVTLFSGLPSDNVRAIAQTSDGVLWFGTDNGLARFDGRRVQTIALAGSESNKILALEISRNGTLWIGTERGAYFLRNDAFKKLDETGDLSITSILTGENVYFSTSGGALFKLNEYGENLFSVEKIPAEALVGSDGKLLQMTSLIEKGGTLVAGTRSRSILVLENGGFFETFSRPRPFFVNALAQDKTGGAWLGADAKNGESGFFSLADIARPQKIEAATGNVLAIETDSGGAWVATEKAGLFRFRGAEQIEHFTFENTSGGLRSNTIYALFVDREGVLWVGTNRGVSRFDVASPFNRVLSEENPNSNFVRALYRSRNGQILAGTNRGLFAFDGEKLARNSAISPRAPFIQLMKPAPTKRFSPRRPEFFRSTENKS